MSHIEYKIGKILLDHNRVHYLVEPHLHMQSMFKEPSPELRD